MTSTTTRFERATVAGRLSIEPLSLDDAATVQRWLAHPNSAFWQMTELSAVEVRDYFAQLGADEHQHAWLGRRDGEPAFLVESYDPARVLLNGVHDALPGDVGMHLLVAPPTGERIGGLTSAVMATVVAFVFEQLGAERIVVEPDVHNRRIAAKNAEVGFRILREIELPGKLANLSVLERDVWAAGAAAGQLSPHTMATAQRHLVAKAIAEFTHERLLAPREVGAGSYVLPIGDGGTLYSFDARRFALEHWVIDEASLIRVVDGAQRPLDARELILELQDVLGIPETLIATYLEEITSTLASAAFKLATPRPGVESLVDADYQSIEAAMTEGHPGFVANNGRIGFGLDEFRAYAPESGARFRLVWLAARRELTTLSLGAGVEEAAHYDAELGPDVLDAFAARLRALGLDPAQYRYLPVHPWQWQHRIAITFAVDLAQHDLVHLGEAPDRYQAQQSIRTMFDRTDPSRSYVKTALAIQNMGFLRGLSPAYMGPTPAINDWVAELVATDATLQAAGFSILREHAAIGYTGDVYHRTAKPSAHRKMLAALWRESPIPRLREGERAATMAALLHRDADGASLATAFIRASGLDSSDWLRAYLRAYLLPVVHCLTVHELAFMPHGENLILVLQDHVVTRVFMKDIGEEIAVLGERALPAEVERVRQVVDDPEKALAVFTDVFDGVFRHLAAILDQDGVLPEAEFWSLVAECIDEHAAAHPQRNTGIELRTPRFDHSCLNRLQLRNTLQMVDIANQSDSLIYAGTIANPIANPSANQSGRADGV
ncbi:GNAT family N-acetyltransferase [Microbacteriaceae bacterium VKM Ac-2854]|nr:GNAT family N-acetyltransferase [Microbacteriaceae bacterium VKM Ac-2854]